MIVALVSDPYQRTALQRAARADEDVVSGRSLAMEAVELGFPRLVVYAGGVELDAHLLGVDPTIPVLHLSSERLRAWEERRLVQEIPPGRLDHLTVCLRHAIADAAREVSWVDRALADLSRFAGVTLPPALRSFGRKVLEFPSHYDDLHPLAGSLDLSRGALKARFRRRGLDSPYTYLRWFRVMACAHVLADRSLTVSQVATRLGFTSDGNLCRSVISLTGMTPTELRTVKGWNRLLMAFAWRHLDEASLDGWDELTDLFPAHVA